MDPRNASHLALQEQMIAFIRAFGLHRPEQTPCGQPISVAEAHALMELDKHQPLSQTMLGERLHLVKSTVSRLVGLLEQRGYVERRPDPRDKRAVQVWLTDQGKHATVHLAEARQAKFSRLLERIPLHEQDAVIAMLKRLVEVLHDD